jgi:hypothetical protein
LQNKKSFYEILSGNKSERFLKKNRLVYTPKHASWSKIAEIEINLLDHNYLDRKIGNRYLLKKQMPAWCYGKIAVNQKI